MKQRLLLGLVCLLLNAAGALAAHWTVNPHGFQYDMTFYCVLQSGGDALTNYADYEVAAFCGDECRGVAKVQTATNGTKYLYMRIYSNETQNETIRFCVFQTSTKSEKWLPETVDFESLAMTGTPGEPMTLTIGNTKRGDANGDGNVSVTDIAVVVNCILQLPNTGGFSEYGADANGDGSVTVTDIGVIVDKILGTNGGNARQAYPQLLPKGGEWLHSEPQ